jgi:hypothetical protein
MSRRLTIGIALMAVAPGVYWLLPLPDRGSVPVLSALLIPFASGVIAGSNRIGWASLAIGFWAIAGDASDRRVDGGYWRDAVGIAVLVLVAAVTAIAGAKCARLSAPRVNRSSSRTDGEARRHMRQ